MRDKLMKQNLAVMLLLMTVSTLAYARIMPIMDRQMFVKAAQP
jgi:hypothetical protein